MRIQGNEKRRGEDSSHSKGIEVLVRKTAEKGYPDPEKVDNSMTTALQNRNLLATSNRSVLAFSYSCDHSWDAHQKLPCKVTREVEGQREDKIEEAKKQKIPKNSDEKRLHQMEVFIWQKWSADETRERTSWQSADWDSSDQVRKVTAWQASADWNTLDQTREHPDWQSYADWNSLKHTRDSSDWQPPVDRSNPDRTSERDTWQSPFKWQ